MNQFAPKRKSDELIPEIGAAPLSPPIVLTLPIPESRRRYKGLQGLKCSITFNLAFFFDGTNNNMEADRGTLKHSNIARLYSAHSLEDKMDGRYHFYIPGVGTYFKEIGDEGGTGGLAFAAGGQARLDWAMGKFKGVVDHSAEEIVEIRIALFGFSRGAALARAFARELDQLCPNGLYNKLTPIRIYFMGLFDTVASVGLPAGSGVNVSFAALSATASQWQNYESKLVSRRHDFSNGLAVLAFGEAGADPTPTWADGHMSWAKNLRLPPLVKDCLHLVAAHEQRHSFPLDSLREGQRYPLGCEEMVYPGMHSNVGGGYRPGEEGKSARQIEMMSQVPLLVMYQRAKERGVPLENLGALTDREAEDDFLIDPNFLKIYNDYQARIPHASLGLTILAHMRFYFAWRFFRIRNSRETQLKLTQTEEKRYAEESAKQSKTVDDLEKVYQTARRKLARAQSAIHQNLRETRTYFPSDKPAELEQAYQQARTEQKEAEERWLKERSLLNAIPGVNKLNATIPMYDRLLVQEAAQIEALAKNGRKLRPHYQGLMDAWLADKQGQGLDKEKDAELIRFFDIYMHDSLAGFAIDLTLPSDPRCIYAGGDKEVNYANTARRTDSVMV